MANCRAAIVGPLVGPLVGGVIGVLVHDLFIGDVLDIRTRMAKIPEVGCTRPVTTTPEVSARAPRG
ncbi:hypothetical protein [Streptomyces violaceusniger]|uniref:Uncharacterized protein n=1 Tax=Streptomyces violaceusniger TaxID=68280 RepID=A0A4D4LAR4_STRVO|nr:hypothetical protein SVIO_067630 [Streptomyces violaceusniger]